MEFLRKQAAQKAEGFKELADEVWDELGDIRGISKGMKQVAKTGGKYALAAQLLMMLNYPDEAEMLRDSYNVTGAGPTGAQGFQGTPLAHMLDATAALVIHRNTSAISIQGYADAGATSTMKDLITILPQLRSFAKEGK